MCVEAEPIICPEFAKVILTSGEISVTAPKLRGIT